MGKGKTVHMVEFLKRAIAPRGLGLAFTLAVIPYLCRVDNAFMWMLDAHGVVTPLEVSVLLGIVAGCVLIVFVPVGPNTRQAKEAIGGALLIIAGIVAAGFVETLPPLACAVVGGLCIGAGFVASLRQWFVIYAPLSTETALTTASLALFLASVVWYAVRHTNNFYVLCFCMAVCVVCGGLICLIFLVLDIRNDRLASPDPGTDSVPAEAADGSSAKSAQPHPWWISFAGAGALWFNFFTLGLTMYTDSAGVEANSVTNKMLPYAVVAVVIIGITYLLVRRKAGFTLFLASILAVAGAIELASPFIDDLFTPGSLFYATLSYSGVALFNVLGFALPLRKFDEKRRSFSAALATLLAGCVVAMGVGMLVFQVFGQSGQLVSLCVITIYMVALVIAAMNTGASATRQTEEATAAAGQEAADSANAPSPAPVPENAQPAPEEKPAPAETADPRKLACEHLAEQYQLSPRESEVLWLLARGYGARYIGERLFISADTVRTHCKRIYEKVGVHNKEELIEVIESFE